MDLHSLKQQLLARDPLPPLFPETIFQREWVQSIEGAKASETVRAGLHLLNDDLEHCHRIAQTEASDEHNYWHALLHRREGYLDNALYWYRRLGDHPVLQTMKQRHSGWSPRSCIDPLRGKSGKDLAQQALLFEEMSLLLEHCWAESEAS